MASAAGADEAAEAHVIIPSTDTIEVDNVYYGSAGKYIERLGRISVVNLFRFLSLIPHRTFGMSDAAEIPFYFGNSRKPKEFETSMAYMQFYALRYYLGLQAIYGAHFYPAQMRKVLETAHDDTAEAHIQLHDSSGASVRIEDMLNAAWQFRMNEPKLYNITIAGKTYDLRVEHTARGERLMIQLDQRLLGRYVGHDIWGIGFRIIRPSPMALAAAAAVAPASPAASSASSASSSSSAAVATPVSKSTMRYVTPSPDKTTPGSQLILKDLEELKGTLDKLGRPLARGFYESLKAQQGLEKLPEIDDMYRPVMDKLNHFYSRAYHYLAASPEFDQLSRGHDMGTPEPMPGGAGGGGAGGGAGGGGGQEHVAKRHRGNPVKELEAFNAAMQYVWEKGGIPGLAAMPMAARAAVLGPLADDMRDSLNATIDKYNADAAAAAAAAAASRKSSSDDDDNELLCPRFARLRF